MLAVSPAFQTALPMPARAECQLFEMEFTTGTLRLNTWGVDRDFDGFTWIGKGQLLEVSATSESEDGGRQRFTVTLPGVLLSNVGLALGDPSVYRGRQIKIYVCLLSAAGVQLEPAVLRVLGFMDKVSIQPDPQDGGDLLRVVLECYSNRFGAVIDAPGFRVNNASHQALHPGELGLERAHEINTKPQTWLTKKAQEIRS